MTRIILNNGTFLVGADFRPVTGMMAITDGRITEVSEHVRPQAADEVIDLGRAFVMPGLIDAHCHLMYREVADPYDIELRKSIAEATLDAVANAGELLRAGFTTVRDVGSRGNIGVEIRKAITDGRIRGPRVLPAGQIISAPGGLGDLHPSHIFEDRGYPYSLAIQVVGPHQARAVVRRQIKDGVDWIKVGLSGTGFNPLCPAERNGLSEEEFDAVMAEARQQGIPVAVHAESAASVLAAARHAADSIEHGIYIGDEALELMVRNRVFLSPTLSMYRAFATRGSAMGIPQVIVDQHKRTHSHHVTSVRKAYEAGVPIVAGGDAGLTHFPQGSCADEARSYVELIGMTPAEALRTLTVNTARLLGLAEMIGTIDPGKTADLLILDVDPLADVTVLSDAAKRRFVIQSGQVVWSASSAPRGITDPI
jgi:imidazolonepropionase-like amidohydrolase